MIPHPLTLLLCWLIGTGLAEGLGYVLQFIGELCADALHAGILTAGGYSTVLTVLSLIAVFAAAVFVGAAMRLWADKPWPKAVLWALTTSLLIGVLNSSIPLRMYPAAGLGLLTSPRFWLIMPLGSALGAYGIGRFEHDARVEAVRDAIRGIIFWER